MKKLIATILAIAIALLGISFALEEVGAKAAQFQHLELMRTLLPGSNHFEVEHYTGEDKNILSVHKAETGYVVETSTYGYASPITMLVAVNFDGKVIGLVVTDAHETFGLGSKILTDHVFLSQFLNRNDSFTVNTSGADAFSSATGTTEETGNEWGVDGISGATVSSKAVVRCINSAVAYVTGADAVSSATTWGG